MTVIGQAQPRSDGVIAQIAETVGCEPAVIDAIIKVETQADAYDPSKRLIIRPEAHKVAQCPYLDSRDRKRAAKLRLTRQPKLIGYHVDPVRAGSIAWQWVDKVAAEFGEEAAFWVTSFGSPQIMGFNYKMCGYSSPSAMVRDFANSEDAQLKAMGRFLIASGLKDACRQRKWKTIARIYNGPAYARNAYDAKLSDAYEDSLQDKNTSFIWPEDDVLEMGESGHEVAGLQRKLSALGYPLNADGDFGAETRSAVRSFQFDRGLDVDGKVGPETRAALASAPPKPAPSTPVAKVVAESSTAKASIAQIATGAAAATVATANALVPAQAPSLPSLTDVDGVLKVSDQGVALASKILAIGVDKLVIALGVGAIIFGGIALYRRIDAHYSRKIG